MKASTAPLVLAIFTAVSWLATPAFGQQYTPPTEGKYFFAEMKYDKARSYIQLGVGSNGQMVNAMLNSEELALALFTTNCSNPAFGQKCDVPNPFNIALDSFSNGPIKNISYERAYLFSKSDGSNIGKIQEVYMSGFEASTIFNITVPNFLREFNVQNYIFEVIQVNQAYTSDLVSGYIGLGPYSAIGLQDPTNSNIQPEENFLYSLRDQGFIDNQIVSFYVSKDYKDGSDKWYGIQMNDTESFVKFGGFDEQGFQNSSEYSLIEPIDVISWAFKLNQLKFISGTIDHKYLGVNAIIEPAYPYIYLPQNLWDGFTQLMENRNVYRNLDIHNDFMLFRSTCDNIDSPFTIPFTFTLPDGKEYTFNMMDLVVNSEEVSGVSGFCYLGIFPSTVNGGSPKNANLIYFGQLYLRKFYTFFDSAGFQSGQTLKLQIGTGYKNNNARILENHYNSTSPDYSKQSGDQSKWTYVPNQFTNPDIPQPDPDTPVTPDDKPDQPQPQPQPEESDQPSMSGNGAPNEDDENNSMIIIIVIVGVVSLLLIVATIAYCKCRGKGSKAEEDPQSTNLLQDDSKLDNTRIQDNDESIDTTPDVTDQ